MYNKEEKSGGKEGMRERLRMAFLNKVVRNSMDD